MARRGWAALRGSWRRGEAHPRSLRGSERYAQNPLWGRSSGARAAFCACADDRGALCGAAPTSRGSSGSSWRWGNSAAVARWNRCAPLSDVGETVRVAVARAPRQIVKACLAGSTCSEGRSSPPYIS